MKCKFVSFSKYHNWYFTLEILYISAFYMYPVHLSRVISNYISVTRIHFYEDLKMP